MSEIEKLKTQNAELADRIAKLEEAAKPAKPFEPLVWQRPDYTEGMSMPRNAMQAMIDAVPESLMAELRADARKPNPVTGYSSPQPTSQGPRGTGWVEPRPLESPPGVGVPDQLMDEQDRLDRVALAEKMAAAEAAMKGAKENK